MDYYQEVMLASINIALASHGFRHAGTLLFGIPSLIISDLPTTFQIYFSLVHASSNFYPRASFLLDIFMLILRLEIILFIRILFILNHRQPGRA